MFYRLSPQLGLRTRWHPHRAKPSEQILVIRSGEAFPPSHPTTRLCLDLLREVLATGPASSLVDVGCGTGILGLAAAALGVGRVVAVDMQRRAVRVTRENARKNALAGRLHVVQGSTECLHGSFDLVVANLPWEVQLDKVLELDRLAGEQGRLILSGFRDHQETPLLEGYLKVGRSLLRRLVKDFHHPELPVDMSFTWVAWLLAARDSGRGTARGSQ